MFGCCVEGHGLVRTIGDGRMVGLADPAAGLVNVFLQKLLPPSGSINLVLISEQCLCLSRGYRMFWSLASCAPLYRKDSEVLNHIIIKS